jgi:hypothetical protein
LQINKYLTSRRGISVKSLIKNEAALNTDVGKRGCPESSEG